MSGRERLVIATRASPLALWQARYVRDLLRGHAPGLEIALREITTTGDRSDRPLAEVGGKGVFLKELEHALLRGDADLAVHSVKDMPAALPRGLVLAAVCARADPRDAFISNRFASLADLPPDAVLGTGSLRRRSQLRARFPRLRVAGLRGNVGSRLAKLDAGDCDAMVLAAAGLKRLGLEARIREIIRPAICLPAAGQGAIGVECRDGDHRVLNWAAALNHADTAVCVAAERAVTAGLGGDCHLPLAAFAELHDGDDGGEITLRARVISADGARLLRSEKRGPRDDAAAIGHAAAEDLLANGAAALIAAAKTGDA
ncbi:MAG: hydroxymethylbilane synthase [Gammaproteobacteria bacterium]|nr:hydroxymethylbilane synthase [Gammaproteobacteria bacterium]